MTPTIGVVDYGMGNLRSVCNAFEAIDTSVQLVTSKYDLDKIDGLVLPGVGAFGDGMENLLNQGLIEPLTKYAAVQQRPLLGICVGMQLFSTRGTEHENHEGLGLIPGIVSPLDVQEFPDLRVPHIGWNDVEFSGACEMLGETNTKSTYYFVHSYAFCAEDTKHVVGETEHGTRFASCIAHENIVGVQFHPEKSHKAGLTLLRNWAGRIGKC